MTETIASLIGAIVGAIITTSFWFVQHRIEQKDVLNNERRQDKRELVKNIMRNRMDQGSARKVTHFGSWPSMER